MRLPPAGVTLKSLKRTSSRFIAFISFIASVRRQEPRPVTNWQAGDRSCSRACQFFSWINFTDNSSKRLRLQRIILGRLAPSRCSLPPATSRCNAHLALISSHHFPAAPQDGSKNRFAFCRGPLNPLRIYERDQSMAGHRAGRDRMAGKDRRMCGRFFVDRPHDRIGPPFFRGVPRVFYCPVHGRHSVFALRCPARQAFPTVAGGSGARALRSGRRDLSKAHTRHRAGGRLRGRLLHPRHATPGVPPSARRLEPPSSL